MRQGRKPGLHALVTLGTGWLALPLVAVVLRWRGVQATRALLAGRPRVSSATLSVSQVARCANAAARLQPLTRNCLARSVVLEWLLARHGHEAQLRVGTRRAGPALEAHAWVEHEGVPLNDTADVAERFASFPALPASGRSGAP